MADIGGDLLNLYEKDISAAYKSLQRLEALSREEDVLYPRVDEFIAMMGSETYVIRVRGFRLLCQQARWDTEDKLDANIDKMLGALQDEKPTAVRQALKALEDLVPHKKALCPAIRRAAEELDYSHFKDTMQPLIHKDIQRLVALIDAQ